MLEKDMHSVLAYANYWNWTNHTSHGGVANDLFRHPIVRFLVSFNHPLQTSFQQLQLARTKPICSSNNLCVLYGLLSPCIADAVSAHPQQPPVLSRLTYHWVLRFLKTYPLSLAASQNPQDPVDAAELDNPWITPSSRSFDPETLTQRFDTCWKKETTSGRNSLVHAIVRAFAADLWLTSFLRLLVYFSDVALPLLVARIIQQAGNASTKQHASSALATLLSYTCLALIGAVVEQNQIDLRDRTALKIRIALTSAVHNKAIETGGGLPTKHPQTDVYSSGIHSTSQLASHIVSLSQAIWLPARVVAGLYVFYRQVGWAVAPGIVVILLYLPLRTRFMARRSAAKEQAAKASSQRVFLITQLFDNIVSLRMLGWDSLLVDRIARVRKNSELNHTIKAGMATLFLTFARAACRAGGPLASLFIYSTLSRLANMRFGLGAASSNSSDKGGSEGPYVTAEQVFVVQALLRELFPLLIDVPHTFDSWWDAKLPYKKILDILTLAPESCRKPRILDRIDEKLADDLVSSYDIRISDGAFAWKTACKASEITPSDAFSLKSVDLDIRQNQLVAVIGAVGSGKSSLLAAVLGEMSQCSGSRHVARQTAFVSQSPWLMAGTVRENILFGKPFDSHWYAKVIGLCQLSHDLSRWSAGDQTAIGSNGLALSGGQRMRVALARAVYSKAEIYILDDVLAAVDPGVGQRLVDGLLAGKNALLKNTTRLVVSRDPRVLLAADGLCVVDKGRVLLKPCPLVDIIDTQFAKNIIALAGISTEQLKRQTHPDIFADSVTEPHVGWLDSTKVTLAMKDLNEDVPPALATPPNSTLKPKPAANSTIPCPAPQSSDANPVEKSSSKINGDTHNKTSEMEQQYMVPVKYMLRLCGGYMIAAHSLTVAIQCLTSKQVQLWLAKPIPLARYPVFSADTLAQWSPTMHHFALCVLWWFADALLDLGSQWWTEIAWRRAMFVKSHEELLRSVSSAPLSFFTSMPTGRILSLFTDSQNDVDLRMPQRLANLATFTVKLAFESWVVLMFHPMLVAAVATVLFAMWGIVVVSRRPLAAIISAQTESLPLIDEQFQDSLAGASTIRAFSALGFAKSRLYSRLYTHVSAQRAGDSIETWIDLSMTLLREAVTVIAFSIALVGSINGVAAVDHTYMTLVHMCVTFVLARLQHLIRHSHSLRSSLTRSGKYIQYTDMDSEQQLVDNALEHSKNYANCTVSDSWPEHGGIVFDNVCARYNSDRTLDTDALSCISLCNMSFEIRPGQHIGIVGRTGAGKSSIAMALFGLLHLESGSITIDNIDIRLIPLKTLRKRLSIVPQTPYLLPGSVRDNIDPYGQYSAAEIHQSLQSVGLITESTNIDKDTPVDWSIGQQQLLALSRALLQNPKILVLDEATASVDLQASQKLHMLIRTHFAHCTVLTIAHRPEALVDCDLVLNVQDGFIIESGRPMDVFTKSCPSTEPPFGNMSLGKLEVCTNVKVKEEEDGRENKYRISGPPTPP
ncbi:hypothetical protein GGF40_001701 [Coemansia sp. RSA 1286]|nr:hypothetical protein GGF40_001701 [Coemansia sp. RSA 1286]